jgi:hypothetical protein
MTPFYASRKPLRGNDEGRTQLALKDERKRRRNAATMNAATKNESLALDSSSFIAANRLSFIIQRCYVAAFVLQRQLRSSLPHGSSDLTEARRLPDTYCHLPFEPERGAAFKCYHVCACR